MWIENRVFQNLTLLYLISMFYSMPCKKRMRLQFQKKYRYNRGDAMAISGIITPMPENQGLVGTWASSTSLKLMEDGSGSGRKTK